MKKKHLRVVGKDEKPELNTEEKRNRNERAMFLINLANDVLNGAVTSGVISYFINGQPRAFDFGLSKLELVGLLEMTKNAQFNRKEQ